MANACSVTWYLNNFSANGVALVNASSVTVRQRLRGNGSPNGKRVFGNEMSSPQRIASANVCPVTGTSTTSWKRIALVNVCSVTVHRQYAFTKMRRRLGKSFVRYLGASTTSRRKKRVALVNICSVTRYETLHWEHDFEGVRSRNPTNTSMRHFFF